MTTDPYPNADPEEFVTVAGIGPMTLRAAVRGYVSARARYENGLMTAHREEGREPSMFHAADLGRLAELAQFR